MFLKSTPTLLSSSTDLTVKMFHPQYVKHILWNRADFILSTGPVQVKELTFSCGIAAHDLSTKLKQVESWLEKKHHVRLTVRSGRGEPAVNLVRKNTHVFGLY